MLPSYLRMAKLETFPISPKIFHFREKNTKTNKTDIVSALHVASAYAICRGKERSYMLFSNERTGKTYLEEVMKDNITNQVFLQEIKDEAEFQAIRDYIDYHMKGGKDIKPALKNSLQKSIVDCLGVNAYEQHNIVITPPDTVTVTPEFKDPTDRDERQEEKLATKD